MRRFTRPPTMLHAAAALLASACEVGDPHALDDRVDPTEVEPTEGDHDSPPEPTDEATGPVELEAPHAPVAASTPFISGRVTYHPDFSTIDPGPPGGDAIATPIDDNYVGRGRVPSYDASYAKLRYLFVCAYDADGGLTDFRSQSQSDDDLLGCARADMYGRYIIPVERANVGTDVYLVTSFCDGPQVPITVPGTTVTYDDIAEVCIRPNHPYDAKVWQDLNEGGGDPEIKYMASRAYIGLLDTTGETRISWNLSCPNQWGHTPLGEGSRYDPVICSGSGSGQLEPTETAIGAVWVPPSWIGNTNSNLGHNKEFVHMFVSMVENLRWYGTYKPNPSNAMFGVDVCSDARCSSPVYVYACDTFYGFEPYREPGVSGGGCGAASPRWNEITMNHRCPGSGAPLGTCADLNPHVVAHELGHIMQYRWGQTSGGSKVNSERYNTMEGWADFVALATWYDQNAATAPNAATDPHFNFATFLAEDQYALGASNWAYGTCGPDADCACAEGALYQGQSQQESREAMFFWDLYDTGTDGGSDNISLNFTFIRSHWNLFGDRNNDGDKRDDHESSECFFDPDCTGDDGVNLEDFQWWWDDSRPITAAPDIGPVMALNCVDRHTDGLGCVSPNNVCTP